MLPPVNEGLVEEEALPVALKSLIEVHKEEEEAHKRNATYTLIPAQWPTSTPLHNIHLLRHPHRGQRQQQRQWQQHLLQLQLLQRLRDQV